jgi:hypothetical protein
MILQPIRKLIGCDIARYNRAIFQLAEKSAIGMEMNMHVPNGTHMFIHSWVKLNPNGDEYARSTVVTVTI